MTDKATQIPRSLYAGMVFVLEPRIPDEKMCPCWAEDRTHRVNMEQIGADLYWWIQCDNCGAEMEICIKQGSK